jgi:hypothetical protein
MFHDGGLADAGRANNVQRTIALKSFMCLVNQFCPGKPYTANLVLDFVQCSVRSLRQAIVDGS